MVDNHSAIHLLVEQWEKAGVKTGDVLLVHSAIKALMKKLKDSYGLTVTPTDIYNSLLVAVNETKGTLILPTFNFDFSKTKYFNIQTTPSQMGALTEVARNNPRAVRTGHPIYSFSVIGKYQREFENINNRSGYGSDSPFAKTKELDGKIAVIGLSDQDSMTSYHFVEEQCQVDYRYFKKFSGIYVDKSGRESPCEYELFVRDLERGVLTDVNRMMERLWQKGLYTGERYDQGYGIRTILFKDLYRETAEVIVKGDALNYLYSIKKT